MENNNNHYRQEVELLSDLAYHYNRNHLEYNRNMSNLITTIQYFLERNQEPREPRENRRNRDTFRETNNRRYNNNRTSPFTNSPFFSFANIPINNTNPGLTIQQIEQSTEIVPYATEMRDVQCPISFEDFVVGEDVMRIIFCGHIFKPDSIRNWFRRNKRCPVCRHDLTTYTRPAPVREINVDISLNRIPRLPSIPNERLLLQNETMPPLSDIENSIVENINRIFQNVSIPEENGELESTLSRYIFEFPIYFDISNNRM